jgi:hypothetical protein
MEPAHPRLEYWEHRLAAMSLSELLIGGAICVASIIASAALATVVLCRLPTDYLQCGPPSLSAQGHAIWKRILIRIGKNLFGALLVVAGVAMSLPGVPGQGLLTILVGMTLLDFPGKIALERRLLSRPSVLRNINRIRCRFGKEPLLPAISEEPAPAPGT